MLFSSANPAPVRQPTPAPKRGTKPKATLVSKPTAPGKLSQRCYAPFQRTLADDDNPDVNHRAVLIDACKFLTILVDIKSTRSVTITLVNHIINSWNKIIAAICSYGRLKKGTNRGSCRFR